MSLLVSCLVPVRDGVPNEVPDAAEVPEMQG